MTTEAKHGFARMSPERQREVASMGGKKAHAMGKGHRWTSEQAREAAKKGGAKTSQNREHMAEIGRKGYRGLRRVLDARKPAVVSANDGDAGGVDDQLIENKNRELFEQ